MKGRVASSIECQAVELDGTRYVILRESTYHWLCERAHVQPQLPSTADVREGAAVDLDRAALAQRLIRRRRAAGLSQAGLARRAGVRPETLNRIERGRTTPDFATIRKLVVAVNAAEHEQAAACVVHPADKEI